MTGALRRLLKGSAAFAATVSLPSAPAGALDPQRSITQFNHTSWTIEQGAPSGISSLRQAADGHLWMTSRDGVFRFDGLTFERMDGEVDHEKLGPPYRLTITRAGVVWVWYTLNNDFAIYRGGRFHFVPSPTQEGTVVSLTEAPDGALWAGIGQLGRPMLRYAAGRWQRVEPTRELAPDTFTNIVFSADGAAWIAYSRRVLRRGPNEAEFREVLVDDSGNLRVALDADGRVWLVGKSRIAPLSGPRGQWPAAGTNVAHLPASGEDLYGAPLFDRDASLWISSRSSGIERIRPGPRGAMSERFRASDGLTSDAISSLIEDREGNIWVATTRGLDRFRPAQIVVEPLLTRPSYYGDVLFSAANGDVYVGQSDTIYRIPPLGQPEPYLAGINDPRAICESAGGTLAFASADDLLLVGPEGRRSLSLPYLQTGYTSVVSTARAGCGFQAAQTASSGAKANAGSR